MGFFHNIPGILYGLPFTGGGGRGSSPFYPTAKHPQTQQTYLTPAGKTTMTPTSNPVSTQSTSSSPQLSLGG